MNTFRINKCIIGVKKSLFLLLLVFCSLSIVEAQSRGDHKDGDKRSELLEKYKSQKIAYLSDKLSLTPDEATKFWPIYNQYADEKETLHKKIVAEIKVQRSNESNSDASLTKMFVLREEELSIEKKYTSKFKDVISSDKILKLFYHEKEFRKELADKMKSRMKSRRSDRN